MRIAAIVQARMSSRRLPGKVLREVAGRPLMEYVLERVGRARAIDEVIVATSIDPSDDDVVTFCAERGVRCHRGPLEDVATRFAQAVERFSFPAFVRVSADSPLLDQHVVDLVATAFDDGAADMATNVFPRSFPHGQSVEILRADAFRRGLGLVRDDHDREHVTQVFYRHRERFRIRNVSADRDRAEVRLAVDTEEDLGRVAAIVARMTRPHWTYDLPAILELYAAAAAARSDR